LGLPVFHAAVALSTATSCLLVKESKQVEVSRG